MLGKAGKTGSLYKTLKAIADQTSPKVIVVRVAAATEEEGGKRNLSSSWVARQKTAAIPACTLS
nr:hypothetical protein SYMBAF_30003 [Serratia symbiotica]